MLGLTEKECRAVMNERIASAAILWDAENYDEDGVFLTRSNMASVCLKHFEDWGWLKQDYDETLNSYVVTFLSTVRCMWNFLHACWTRATARNGRASFRFTVIYIHTV